MRRYLLTRSTPFDIDAAFGINNSQAYNGWRYMHWGDEAVQPEKG